MSLSKARDLLRLAEMAASRHMGVSLAEIAEEFDADHRTAQRMTKALEDVFQNVEVNTDEDRRRRWKLRDPSLLRLKGVGDSELAAAAAKAAPPVIAPALLEVAAIRARHATALVEELSRAAGRPTPTSGAETTAPSAAAPAAATPPPKPQDVVNALRRAEENAAKLAPTLSGYRSGLMGSIAAACRTAWTVGLTPAGRPR